MSTTPTIVEDEVATMDKEDAKSPSRRSSHSTPNNTPSRSRRRHSHTSTKSKSVSNDHTRKDKVSTPRRKSKLDTGVAASPGRMSKSIRSRSRSSTTTTSSLGDGDGDDDHSINTMSISSGSIGSKSLGDRNRNQHRHSTNTSSSTTRARPQQKRSQSAFDGNASMSVVMTKSSADPSTPNSSSSRMSLSRPAGMRERMQQRLHRTAQSERNLNAHNYDMDDDDTRSVSSRRSMASLGMGSVRDRLSSLARVPSIRRLTDASPKETEDSLLLHMSQKVRQLEEEKANLTQQHEAALKKSEARIDRLEKIRSRRPSVDESDEKSLPQPSIKELQTKLDKAMAKITRLEKEQDDHDNLEEQLQDAQIKIATLQLHQNTPPAVKRLSMGSTDASSSPTKEPSPEKRETSPEKDEGVVERKPESPASSTSFLNMFRGGSGGSGRPPSPMPPPPPSISRTSSVGSVHSMSDDRSEKLNKLKAFRRSRESHLKELVLDSQESPTDVQTALRNLQEELKAAKEAMGKQTTLIDDLKIQLREQKKLAASIDHDENSNETMDKAQARLAQTTGMETSTTKDWEEKYRSLRRKYVQFEMDRAMGEFELRDKITSNALKFHRRLLHWKEQAKEKQEQLEKAMEEHAEDRKSLRVKLSEAKETASDAVEDLAEFKRGTEQTLRELVLTQDRLAQATDELQKYKHDEEDPSILQQSTLLQTAIKHKETQRAGWSLRSMIGRQTSPADPALQNAMG